MFIQKNVVLHAIRINITSYLLLHEIKTNHKTSSHILSNLPGYTLKTPCLLFYMFSANVCAYVGLIKIYYAINFYNHVRLIIACTTYIYIHIYIWMCALLVQSSHCWHNFWLSHPFENATRPSFHISLVWWRL